MFLRIKEEDPYDCENPDRYIYTVINLANCIEFYTEDLYFGKEPKWVEVADSHRRVKQQPNDFRIVFVMLSNPTGGGTSRIHNPNRPLDYEKGEGQYINPISVDQYRYLKYTNKRIRDVRFHEIMNEFDTYIP